MKIGSAHIRTVEPTQPGALTQRRPDLAPIPFDRYLRKINREADTVELSSSLKRSEPATPQPEPRTEALVPTPTPPTPTAPPKPMVRSARVEPVVRVEYREVVTSRASTGQLIDILL